MGTDCGLLIKIKGEKKYYRRMFDRLYCFQHISIGPDFILEHEGLKDHNGLTDGPMVNGRRSVRTTDEIKFDHAVQWAKDRSRFLAVNKEALEKDGKDVPYHLHWAIDFLQTLWSVSGWDPPTRSMSLDSNIETLWLAADNGETYDKIIFEDQNTIIDLEVNA